MDVQEQIAALECQIQQKLEEIDSVIKYIVQLKEKIIRMEIQALDERVRKLEQLQEINFLSVELFKNE